MRPGVEIGLALEAVALEFFGVVRARKPAQEVKAVRLKVKPPGLIEIALALGVRCLAAGPLPRLAPHLGPALAIEAAQRVDERRGGRGVRQAQGMHALRELVVHPALGVVERAGT